MMKNIKILSLIIATTLFGCVADDEFDAPDLSGLCNNTITANKEISNLSSISNPTLYTADDVIEGYVVSSDEDGNFYKSISIQKEDGSIGFTVPVDQTNLHNEYRPGTKVAVKLKDRYVGRSNSMIAIGNLFENTNIGRISATEYKNVIIRKCGDIRTDDQLVKVRTIAEAKNYMNTLIEIQDVQFSDASLNKKFYDISLPSPGGGTNHTINDVTDNAFLRVSEFASFANKTVPSGSGKIRGIMTKYNNDFQFIVKSYTDINLDNPVRLQFQTIYQENFNSNFPQWTRVNVLGSQVWTSATFSGNSYANINGFQSGANNPNEDWLISPIINIPNLSKVYFIFKNQRKFAGNNIEVFYSTNYTSGNPNTANWTSVPATLDLDINNYVWTTSSANFTNLINSNIRIAFKYTSTNTASSNWQIDDVQFRGF
jgi:Family of unknown function (DUF5689)